MYPLGSGPKVHSDHRDLLQLDVAIVGRALFDAARLAKRLDLCASNSFRGDSMAELPRVDAGTLPSILYLHLERRPLAELLHLWSGFIAWNPYLPVSGDPAKYFDFLNVLLRVITKVGSQGTRLINWRVVFETLVRMLMAKLSESLLVVDTCDLLLYLVKLDVPGRPLSSLLWVVDSIPIFESVLSFAETVFNRTSLLAPGDPGLVSLNQLIRTLQEDILTVRRGGRSVSELGGPLEIARLSAINGLSNSLISRTTAAMLPADSNYLMQPVLPVQQAFTSQVFVSAVANRYESGQGTEVAFRSSWFAGIQNFNNTCYLSSFLQALFFTDGFLTSIFGFTLRQLPKTEEKDFEQGVSLVSGLQLLFVRLLTTRHPYIEISSFIRSLPPSYRSGEQQDVTESGRWIFDKLGGNEQSLVQSIFGGELVHKTKCSNCQNVTERKEVFTDLCVSVPKEAEVLGKKRVTFQSLIRKLLKPEDLSGDNKYCCDGCGGTKQNATRWIEITQFPSHLMLVMHKFSFDVATCDFKKEKTVVYPEDVDLVGHKYQLYGSILHYGETAMKGHYVALSKRSSFAGKDKADSQWALLDDTTVSMMSQSEAEERMSGLHKATDAAYVVFFKAANAPEAATPRMPQQLVDEAAAVEAAAVHL